jgi:uncharacterized protein HemX
MLRFTIRDVLWLMVVVGMGIGWFKIQLEEFNKQHEQFEEERQAFRDAQHDARLSEILKESTTHQKASSDDNQR